MNKKKERKKNCQSMGLNKEEVVTVEEQKKKCRKNYEAQRKFIEMRK